MAYLKDKQIALFFSYKVSLNIWEDLGIISRESRIWSLFSKNFLQSDFITYGNENEKTLIKEYFPGVTLLNNKWHLNPFIYSILLPLFYRKELKNIDIYKVNQLSGALPAVISKILYKKKLIVRCGFQLSQFFKKQNENLIKIFLVLLLEKIAYGIADLIVVTSPEDKEYIVVHHKINPNKVTTVPNGVDIELFNIFSDIKKESGRILFVGRLIKQKNLFSLLEAIRDIKEAHLVIVGKGYLKEELIRKTHEYKINVTFIDSMKNEDLPIEYNKSELFILPSFFEGNPKVLLEAMACGLSVICSNSYGMNNIIKHSYNGFLCQACAGDIQKAILKLLNDDKLRTELGRNARSAIVSNYSLNKVLEQEISCIENL